jgi:hypothetical protein
MCGYCEDDEGNNQFDDDYDDGVLKQKKNNKFKRYSSRPSGQTGAIKVERYSSGHTAKPESKRRKKNK